MKIFRSIAVLSMLSVMVSADNVSPPTGHTTGRSRVRARNLNGNSVSNVPNSSNDNVSNHVDISPPTGHTTGRSRVRARNLRGTKNGSK